MATQSTAPKGHGTFTFDHFAEELKNTSSIYQRPSDAFNAAKNAPPPPAAIGSNKNGAPRRPPPGFEKKVPDTQRPSDNPDMNQFRPNDMESCMKAFFTNQSTTSRNDKNPSGDRQTKAHLIRCSEWHGLRTRRAAATPARDPATL